MEQADNKKRNIWIAIGIIAAIGTVAAIVIYALVVSSTQPESPAAKSPAPWPRVSTKEEVKQSLTDLESTLKQANSDQMSVESALKDGDKQIKIGN